MVGDISTLTERQERAHFFIESNYLRVAGTIPFYHSRTRDPVTPPHLLKKPGKDPGGLSGWLSAQLTIRSSVLEEERRERSMGTSPPWIHMTMPTSLCPPHPLPILSSLCSRHSTFLLFCQHTSLSSLGAFILTVPSAWPAPAQIPTSLAQVSAPKITFRENTSLPTSPPIARSGLLSPHLRLS